MDLVFRRCAQRPIAWRHVPGDMQVGDSAGSFAYEADPHRVIVERAGQARQPHPVGAGSWKVDPSAATDERLVAEDIDPANLGCHTDEVRHGLLHAHHARNPGSWPEAAEP